VSELAVFYIAANTV